MKKKLEFQQAVEIIGFINTFDEIADVDKVIISKWIHDNTKISSTYKPFRMKKQKYIHTYCYRENRDEVTDSCLPWDEMQWGM